MQVEGEASRGVSLKELLQGRGRPGSGERDSEGAREVLLCPVLRAVLEQDPLADSEGGSPIAERRVRAAG